VTRAEERGYVDLEPVTLRWSPSGNQRFSIFTVGGAWGYATHRITAYAGGGLGFFGLQGRGGIAWTPGDPNESGPLIRIEVRPQLFLAPCVEPAVLGNAGIGYRWPLESGDEYGAGTGLYIMPAFEGGVAWLRINCGSAPLTSTALLGGTLVGGIDW
jgi:hypothetical protein